MVVEEQPSPQHPGFPFSHSSPLDWSGWIPSYTSMAGHGGAATLENRGLCLRDKQGAEFRMEITQTQESNVCVEALDTIDVSQAATDFSSSTNGDC